MRTRLRSLAAAVRWHRRGLAAVAAAIAMLSALLVLRPAPPPTRSVLVAATATTAGTVLRPEHLTLVDLPPQAVPDGALTHPQQAIGRSLVAGLARGQVLTPEAMVDGSRTLPDGQALVPLRLGDPAMASLLRVGDTISVVGVEPDGRPVVLAAGVRVAALPQSAGESGPLAAAAPSGALVLVQTDSTTGAKLALAASSGELGVMLG